MTVCMFILSYGLSELTGFKNWKLFACLMIPSGWLTSSMSEERILGESNKYNAIFDNNSIHRQDLMLLQIYLEFTSFYLLKKLVNILQ